MPKVLTGQKVIVGMSGGVDSSVTAYLLKQQGFDVEGVSFILWESRNRADFTGCCSLEATTSAAKSAAALGIRHSTIDVRGEFIEKVIDPFVESYKRGMTPNPCILCNSHIKFHYLLREADKRGAQFITTGHYARIEKKADSDCIRYHLLKGRDSKKDQSYVLYVLGQNELSRLLLPLGDYRKNEIRVIARSLSLDAADRPESQEICFIEDRDYCGFISKLCPESARPGPVLDLKGKVLGEHQGIFRYTLGQRKGLGIQSLVPRYVVRIDTVMNAVYVGSQGDAMIGEITVRGLRWIMPGKTNRFRATVKVRSTMEDRPAAIELYEDYARVVFDEPVWAPAPGQSAVFYDGDLVLGGGIIESCVYSDAR